MKCKILSLMLLSCLSVNAQKIRFSYDPAGNRILRELVLSSSRSREANPSVSSDMVGDREIKIYPNPTKGKLHIDIVNGKEDEKGKAAVYTVGGATIASCPFVGNSVDLDVSSCVAGVYVLKLEVAGKVTSWKIIKE